MRRLLGVDRGRATTGDGLVSGQNLTFRLTLTVTTSSSDKRNIRNSSDDVTRVLRIFWNYLYERIFMFLVKRSLREHSQSVVRAAIRTLKKESHYSESRISTSSCLIINQRYMCKSAKLSMTWISGISGFPLEMSLDRLSRREGLLFSIQSD